MELSLTKSFRKGVIFPHMEQGRSYYLLFHRSGVRGPFFVKTSDLENSSLFYVGDVHQGSYEGPIVGNCFFSQATHFSSGGAFCVAYTGVLGRLVDYKAVKGRGFGVEIALKTPHYLMWNKRGSVTLIVTPSLSPSIRENLET